MTCPRCGHGGLGSDRCPRCGVVVSLYEASLEKMRRGPQGHPSPVAAGGAVTAPTAPRVPPAPAGAGHPVWARPAAPAAVPAPAAPAAVPAGSRRLTFHGSGGALFSIQVVNACLTMLTLGIYYFWGKVRVRAYLFAQTEFEGDRFAYHGTGRELLLGTLKATLVFFLPVMLLQLVPELLNASRPVRAAAGLVLYAVVLVFVPVAMVGARRYRLSRTSWRGIRCSFRGPTVDFVKLFAGGAVLSALTLGVYYPVFITRQQAFMVSHSYFGSQRFGFDGRGRELLRPFLVMALLFLPTLGLSWFWFAAHRQRFFMAHTTLAGARFRSTVTGGRLLGLTLGNLGLLVVTLGIAWPWLVARTLRFT
ncbi:MAG TPA: DUF898 family protein, partial [Methylomirabilota bacterium]|nr:DUF898 family protein [Methylomirabilota bacterium]